MVDEVRELDENMQMLFNALQRLDTEPENEALKEWAENVLQPEYGVMDGLVANFIDFVDESDYCAIILKILK